MHFSNVSFKSWHWFLAYLVCHFSKNLHKNAKNYQIFFFFYFSNVSFETLAAALILGLFALFILVYTVCLQCCWSNRRCPWFLGKDDDITKDKYSFCPCVQAIHSPDSWQSAGLEQVYVTNSYSISRGRSRIWPPR